VTWVSFALSTARAKPLAVFAVIAAELSAIDRIFSAETLEFGRILPKKNSEGAR
jgi:hypothetical protein